MSKMENKFSTSQEGFEWMRAELPEKTRLSIVNFIWNLHTLPMNINEAAKEDQIRQKCFQEFEIAKNQEFNAIHQELGQVKGQNEILAKQNEKQNVLLTKIENLSEHLMGTAPSAVIGQQGEDWVFQLLNDDPRIQIDHVATGSGGGLGDFVVTFTHTNVKIMLEVKNYKKNKKINKEEREKFFRDLDANAEYSGGILVSLNGGFNDNITEGIVYRTSTERKPFYYLGKLLTMKCPEMALKNPLLALTTHIEEGKTQDVNVQKITNLAQADVVAWEKSVQQAVAVRKSAENHLKLTKESERDRIESRDFFKRGWNELQGIGPDKDEDDEPKKKIAKKGVQKNKMTKYFEVTPS